MLRLSRRALLQVAAGASALKAEPQILPARLKAGDTVGLITPSSYVSDPDELAFAKSFCEFFGLKWKMGRNVGRRFGYLAGTAQERVDDLHAMFSDSSVQGVFCI